MQAIRTVCGEPIRWALTLIKFPLLSHDPKQGEGGGLIICSINNPSAAGGFGFCHQLFDFAARVAAVHTFSVGPFPGDQ